MLGADLLDVTSEIGDHGCGQDGHAVLVALASAYGDLAGGEVDVLYSEIAALVDAEAGAVEE